MFLIERPEGFFSLSREKKIGNIATVNFISENEKFHEPLLATPFFVQVYTILC